MAKNTQNTRRKAVANDNTQAVANDNVKEQAKKKAYNVSMRVITAGVFTDKSNNEYMRATIVYNDGGEQRARTLMARGKALESVKDAVISAAGSEETVRVRVLFDKIPNGGLYFTAIGMPRARAKKAA